MNTHFNVVTVKATVYAQPYTTDFMVYTDIGVTLEKHGDDMHALGTVCIDGLYYVVRRLNSHLDAITGENHFDLEEWHELTLDKKPYIRW